MPSYKYAVVFSGAVSADIKLNLNRCVRITKNTRYPEIGFLFFFWLSFPSQFKINA
jgi:hypothetical protein